MTVSVAIHGKTAIAGIGSAGVGGMPGYSAIELLGQASLKTIADANLKLPDIDATSATASSHAFPASSVAEYLGIHPKPVDDTSIGGSSFELHLLQATLALEADLCDATLICYGSGQRTAGDRLASMSEPQWHETPYKLRHPTTAYALAANRHMHQYGTIHGQLVEVAVSVRQWANLSPEAFVHGPLGVDDALAIRMVNDPLNAIDCCLVADGGGACVVVRAERARDSPNAPVYFLGAARAQWYRSVVSMPDLTVTAVPESAPQVVRMAGTQHADIDLVMPYDTLTVNTLLFLEDLGFCVKGEDDPFVQSGRITPGGELAVSINGGGLSCVHPGMYGMLLIIEMVAQLRHQVGRRQLVKADVALLHGNSGTLSSQVTALPGTSDTLQTPGRQAFQVLPW